MAYIAADREAWEVFTVADPGEGSGRGASENEGNLAFQPSRF